MPALFPVRRGRRPRRRFRFARSTTVVLGGVTALVIQVAGVPALAFAAAPAVSYTYDASGRLATVTTSAGTATYHYDAEGNLTSVTTSAGGPAQGALPGRPAAPAPAITSAKPSSLAPGKTITIEGQGFSPARVRNIVHIGSLMAPVTSATRTRLTVTAPPGQGGVVAVTTPGGTASGPRVKITEPIHPDGPTQGRDPHPLRAAPGVTALSGLVETNHSAHLPGVHITVASVSGKAQASTVTQADGQFLISHLSPGRHQLIITASDVGGRDYGVYAEPVELPSGRTTVMPWVTYLTPLDLSHVITITSPTAHQVTLSTPKLPGLKIEVPKGTVIRGRDGRAVTKLSLTPLTVGRTAYPLAPGMQPGFFTLQPGDATVSGPGLRVIYPNGTGQPPGTAIPYFIDSPNWAGNGWWRYGTGHVSGNGKEIIPTPSTHWHIITLGGFGTNPPPPNGPPPCGGGGGGGGGGSGGGGSGPTCPVGGGDPVSLSTGLFVDQATDLTLHDSEGITLTRTFRQLDDTVRDFGIGMSSSLNFYIVANNSGDFVLYNPGGGQVEYQPTGTTGLYQSVGSPTQFVGSTLTWTSGDADGPFTLDLTNGTVLSFSNPAYLSAITDRFGNKVTITRVAATGQLQTVTTPDGEWIKFTQGNCVAASPSTTCVTEAQDNSGRTVTYSYNSFGQLTSVTNPAGGVTQYGWATCTNSMTCTELTSITDPDGHVTSNTYNPANGWVTGQTDGAGNIWSYSYLTNAGGQITQADVTDPRGTQDDYSFNSAGLLSSVTDAAGTSSPETTTLTFSPTTNMLTSITDPLGRTTSYTYDSLGNVTSVTYLSGTSSAATYSLTYDPTYSRITSITDPLGHTTTIAYNDSAQTETVTDALGDQWVVTLNNEGQPIQVTNPEGGSTYLSYLYGELVAVANPLGEATGAYYDSLGHVLQVTDAEGNTTSYSWSPLGQLASETSPLGAVTSYGYDAAGNLTSVTDANQNKTAFAFNGDDLVTSKTDALGKVTQYTYDGDSNLASITDAAGNKDTLAYDDFNNLSTARYGVSGSTQQTKIVYTYDGGNRLTKAVQAPGGTYSMSYDGLNDVLSQTTPAGTVSHTYDADALPVSMTVPGQAKITYGYDKDNRPTTITQGTAKVTQAYDGLSRVASVTLPDAIKDTSTYDAASDLTAQTFKKGTTNVGAIDYAYNADGLVSSESGSLARAQLPAAVTSNTYNADNELTKSGGTAYSWNADGDLTSNGTSSYTWNAQNQLTGISGAVTAAFTYNPFGQQASATVGGTATSDLYDGTAWNSDVVQEQQGGTVTANLLTGELGQYFQYTNGSGTSSSLLTGPLDSTIALASSSGAITTNYSYTPYGAVTASGSTSANTFEFNASQNQGTGLYLMGARYYNPATGTFLSQDPLAFHGGTSDLYGYSGDDPINFGDPTGCFPNCATQLETFGGGLGTTIGAITGALGGVAINYALFSAAVFLFPEVFVPVAAFAFLEANAALIYGAVGAFVGLEAGFYGAGALEGPLGC